MTDPTGGWGAVFVAAAVLTAVAAIWKVALPLIRIIAKLDEAMPKLFEIADNFGSVEQQVRDLHDYTHGYRHEHANEITKLGMRVGFVEERLEKFDGIAPPLRPRGGVKDEPDS